MRRIVYLGGLAPEGEELSPHLRSREEVGQILLASGVPTAVLQAAVVIGSGSASFEMLRHLTERLPVMVVPKWVDTRIQPIAIRDVLRYLVGVGRPAARRQPRVRHRRCGRPDVQRDDARLRPRRRAARRRMLKVPVLSPRLSSHWVGLVTPVPGGLARPLVESLRNTVVCREHDIAGVRAGPARRPDRVRRGGAPGAGPDPRRRRGDALVERQRRRRAERPAADRPRLGRRGRCTSTSGRRVVDAPPERLWAVIEGIGGTAGWYSWWLAWARARAGSTGCGGAGAAPRAAQPVRPAASATPSTSGASRSRRRRAAAAAGRDEGAGPGVARPRASSTTTTGGTLFHQRAVFAPKGLLGPGVLVGGVAVPRDRVRRHAAQHRPLARRGRRKETATADVTGVAVLGVVAGRR